MDMHDHPSLPLDAGSSGDSSRRTGKTGRAAAREVVAFALAAGQTQAEAAAKGGVSVRTVRSWSGESEFAARVEQLRAEAIGQALGRLSGTMSSAADVLKDLLQSKSEDVRLRASRAILELGVKLREFVALEERVRDLEAKLSAGGGS